MLDRYFSPRAMERDVLLVPSYEPSQALKSSELHNVGYPELTVLFPSWHGAGWPLELITRRLMARNQTVLVNTFHDQILSPNVDQVVSSFTFLKEQIASRLRLLQEALQFQRIHFIGTSLGNVALSMVAEEFTDFDTATMVVPGSSLARSLWYGIRTQHIRKQLMIQEMTEEGLSNTWQNLAPINHVEAFLGKVVHFYVSTDDEIIPSRFQDGLVVAFEDAKIDHTVSYSTKGHIATVGQFYLFGDLPDARNSYAS